MKKQMEQEITINFKWWRTADKQPILDHHREALEESAIERIKQMWEQGYTSGDLHDNVYMLDEDTEDGEDGIDYKGWWSLTTKNL
jgi:hypothetical protein